MTIIKGGLGEREGDIAVGLGIAGATAAQLATTGFVVSQAILSEAADDIEKQDKINIFTNISLISYGLYRYYFGNLKEIKPAAVIAGFPLPTVDELSHAMSNRILKYRATGGIFLAHQKGGDQSLRIVGKAYGPSRFIFLQLLDFLFLYGGARSIDYFGKYIRSLLPATAIPDTFESAVEDYNVTTSPWKKFKEMVGGEGMGTTHFTFPVITRNRIYTSMYIETYEYTESVEHGLNCVEYSIFFRKYVPENKREFVMAVDPTSRKAPNDLEVWYREDVDDTNRKKVEKFNFMMDFGYSLSMLIYRFFTMSVTGFLKWNENIAMSIGSGLISENVGGLVALGIALTGAGAASLLAGSF